MFLCVATWLLFQFSIQNEWNTLKQIGINGSTIGVCVLWSTLGWIFTKVWPTRQANFSQLQSSWVVYVQHWRSFVGLSRDTLLIVNARARTNSTPLSKIQSLLEKRDPRALFSVTSGVWTWACVCGREGVFGYVRVMLWLLGLYVQHVRGRRRTTCWGRRRGGWNSDGCCRTNRRIGLQWCFRHFPDMRAIKLFKFVSACRSAFFFLLRMRVTKGRGSSLSRDLWPILTQNTSILAKKMCKNTKMIEQKIKTHT